MSEIVIPILEDGKSFTPYIFYNTFIKKVANFYRLNTIHEKIIFRLIKENDTKAISSEYYIDPITIPLLLSLCEQLSKYHREPLELFLFNNHGTEYILNFLAKSDFFEIAGSNHSVSKNIFKFDTRYIENFRHKNLRPEHKVRCYSLHDENINLSLDKIKEEESKRDFLIEYYTYKVISHFDALLHNNPNTERLQNLFIEILAELITNGVLHSQSDTYALMFSDVFKTKFSISDNGIGLKESMNKKGDAFFYSKLELSEELRRNSRSILNIPENIETNLNSIFETLYFSMLKNRKGLFDLMCNVVVNCSGYFRLHSENCQIIISNRMSDDLITLHELRSEILKIHNEFLYDFIDEDKYASTFLEIKQKAKKLFLSFCANTLKKYKVDPKFSSIRIYQVKFKGVHIEVEIPNLN